MASHKFGETRDYVPKSSASQFKEFQETFVWQDIQAELEVWLTEIRDLLEDEEGELSDRQTSALRGSAKAIRHMLVLPEILADNISTDQKREQEEKDGESRERED